MFLLQIWQLLVRQLKRRKIFKIVIRKRNRGRRHRSYTTINLIMWSRIKIKMMVRAQDTIRMQQESLRALLGELKIAVLTPIRTRMLAIHLSHLRDLAVELILTMSNNLIILVICKKWKILKIFSWTMDIYCRNSNLFERVTI